MGWRARGTGGERAVFHLALKLLPSIACVAAIGCGQADPPPPPRGGEGRHALIYRRSVYLAGLDERVEIVKGPDRAIGIRADGRRMGLAALRAADRAAHRSRYGPIAIGFRAHLATVAPQEEIAAAVYFQPDADWDRLTQELHAEDGATVAAARAELSAAIVRDAEEIAETLMRRRLRVTGAGKWMPVVFVRGTPAELLDLPDEARIKLVTGTEMLVSEHRCNGGPDKVTEGCDVDLNVFHRIDAAFNAAGFFGKGERIGMLEDVGNCGLKKQHEAFEHTGGIFYSNPLPNPCISEHGTWVASVLSGSNDGVRCGAAEVEIYYANSGLPQYFPHVQETLTTSIYNTAATLNAYEWFSGIGMPGDSDDRPLSAVNESYGCLHKRITCSYPTAAEWEGITQDYFARVYDMTIVKAAGNDNCTFTQEACPWTLNSVCVGSVNSTLTMSCFSSHNNPGTETEMFDSDREEPDLMALGGDSTECVAPSDELVCTAVDESTDAWEGARGTSIAAPAVTSMLTLFRQACEPNHGSRFSQRAMRALLRTAAYGGNPDGPAY